MKDVENTAANRDKLAYELLSTMPLKDLVSELAEGLIERYRQDNDLFQADWQEYFGETYEESDQ